MGVARRCARRCWRGGRGPRTWCRAARGQQWRTPGRATRPSAACARRAGRRRRRRRCRRRRGCGGSGRARLSGASSSQKVAGRRGAGVHSEESAHPSRSARRAPAPARTSAAIVAPMALHRGSVPLPHSTSAGDASESLPRQATPRSGASWSPHCVRLADAPGPAGRRLPAGPRRAAARRQRPAEPGHLRHDVDGAAGAAS